ncbi:DEAD/DEAH box helicase [bacterium]|nr:DEAD/DEAH box helicase [bacterium]
MTQPQPPRFEDWCLRPELSAAVAQMGFTHPTPVQHEAFPVVVERHDVMVQSRTGTGKTLAFGLPLFQRLEAGERRVRIAVIVPTRELAMQVGTELAKLARTLDVKVATLVGGAPYGEQLRALREGAAVVVGTPGRVRDHLSRGTLKLEACDAVVLDEADEILDMGFKEELEEILGQFPDDHQTLLFSATLDDEIERIARTYMRTPKRITMASNGVSTTIRHAFYEVSPAAKFEALANVLHVERPELAICFCHTKAETEQIAERLGAEGFKVGVLNGDRVQAQRTQTLQAFRQRQIAILVATDVAARGIDVRGLSHVINMGVPRNSETYVHRTGRTGRAGKDGVAITLVAPLDRPKVRRLALDLKIDATPQPVPQAAEVQAKGRETFFESMVKRTDESASEQWGAFAATLVENLDPVRLVAALLEDLNAADGRLPTGYDVPVPTPMRKEKPLRDKPKRAERVERKDGVRPTRGKEEGMTRLSLNMGRQSRMMPGFLVQFVCKKSGINGKSIGAIEIRQHHTVFDVRDADAQRVIQAMNGQTDERGRKLTVSVV